MPTSLNHLYFAVYLVCDRLVRSKEGDMKLGGFQICSSVSSLDNHSAREIVDGAGFNNFSIIYPLPMGLFP